MFDPTVARRGIGFQWDNVIWSQAGGDASFMALTKAVITRESGWNPQIIRPEPKIHDASYGLMQVLLRTARLFAPAMTPDDLLEPITNLVMGTSLLHDLLGRYGDLPSVVSAYNAGRPRLDLNQGYVNDVLGYYSWFLQNDPLVTQAQAPAALPDPVQLPASADPATAIPDPAVPAEAVAQADPAAGGLGLGGLAVIAAVVLAALLLVDRR